MTNTEFTIHRNTLQVVTSRIFKATPERLWHAYTTADEMEQWWGPRSLSTKVDKLDVKVGGKWRIIHTDDKGQEFIFGGEYRELTPPKKLVYTFTFEAMPQQTSVGTITFEDLGDGKTKLTEVVQFSDAAGLEGMVQGGMEQGATESYERLAELTESS